MRKVKNVSKIRLQRISQFREIYIQEFLRGYRPELIVKTISENYLVAEQTVRDLIKPATLKGEIEAGKHKINPAYQSIVQAEVIEKI